MPAECDVVLAGGCYGCCPRHRLEYDFHLVIIPLFFLDQDSTAVKSDDNDKQVVKSSAKQGIGVDNSTRKPRTRVNFFGIGMNLPWI
jgi:hypothetical protein